MSLLYPTLLAIIGQVLTFLQMQGSYKWGWYEKYPVIVVLISLPSGWCFIKSVDAYIEAFNGDLWPSRLIGFGLGTIVFTFMSILLFNEPMTTKTISCLLLSVTIILIQIYWR